MLANWHALVYTWMFSAPIWHTQLGSCILAVLASMSRFLGCFPGELI